MEVKFDDIEKMVSSLTTALKLFHSNLERLGVSQLTGVKNFFVFYNIGLLLKEIQTLHSFAIGKMLPAPEEIK
jgi:hypothetical protein